METSSRSLDRNQSEGIKFEFKLDFKVTRIPSSGWDKLVLSLISVETGKTSAKTPKSLVRNGTCQWTEPIIESTRLTSDPSTGEYADKLYRIVVQMVSVRVSILGEARINLSDYASAESPESISLPLMNCSTGSCLDVKVQCLTPRLGFRQTRGQWIGNYEQEYNDSISEDNSSNSDVSENLTVRSLGSSSSQNMSVRTSGSHQIKKGARSRTSFPKDGSSSMDSLLTRTDGNNGQLNSHVAMQNGSRSSKALSQKLESAEATIQDLREEASKWERQVRKLSVDMGILKQQLTVESKNGADLKVELLASKAECDSLRLELEQKKKMASKDNYGRWEMDDSKLQINMLQEQVAYQKELNADLHLQLSKMRDSYGELVSALKDLEDSLDAKNAEVDKLKEANKELLKELSNCRESPESQGGSIRVSTEENQYNDDTMLPEIDFNRKLKDKDREIKQLMSKVTSLEGESRKEQPKGENIDESLKTIEILRKKMEELEMDCRELTNENIELHYRLNQTSKDLESKVEIIAELQQACKGSNADILQDSLNRKLQESRDSIAKVQLQVDELNRQKLNLEELVHTLETEKRDMELQCRLLSEEKAREETTSNDVTKHVAEIERLTVRVADYETDKKNLEALLSETTENTTFLTEKLQNLTQDLAEAKATVVQLEAILAGANSTIVLLEARIEKLTQDSGHTILQLEIEKGNLQKSLDDAHLEIEAAKERLRHLLQGTETSESTGDAITDAKITLEKTVSKLTVDIKEFRDRFTKLEAMNVELSERKSSLEAEVRNVSEERESYQQQLENANSNSLHYRKAIKELESQRSLLEQQLQEKTVELIQVQEKLVMFETQKTQDQQELNIKEQALRMEIQSLQCEKENAEHRASRAEEELSVQQKDKDAEIGGLESKLEQLTLSVEEKEKLALVEVTELCEKKRELEISLKHMEERSRELESELSTLQRDSESKNDEMAKKLDASLTTYQCMTEKLEYLQQELENQEREKIKFSEKVEMLENELQQKANALSEMESEVLNSRTRFVELQKRCEQLEDDARSSKRLLVTRETEFAQKESDLCQRIEILELTNEQLEAGIADLGVDQLKNELVRLQTQNSSLSRRGQELLSAMHTQEVLEEEVKRLQESNELLEARISKVIETAKSPLLLERVVNLETELAEVMEANNMYKQQLRSILVEHQNDMDQVVSYKKEIAKLTEEVRVMRERYSIVSLQLAETEVEKSELQMRMRREVR